MTKIEQLIRADLVDIESYRLNSRNPDNIWLDMNELPWDDCFANSCQNFNRYPIVSVELKAKVAAYYEVKPSQVLLTRGSDDGIDLLIRLFGCPFQDNILICPPTFPMYGLNAKYQGVGLQTVPLCPDNFTLDVKKILKATTSKTKLLFLCSPNNPTGTIIPHNDILALCNALQDKAIVVIDEAYCEFSNSPSATAYLEQFPNLVVLRTFSKAFGLAGARCGTILANEDIIRFLQKIIPPFALSQPTLDALSIMMQPTNIEKVKNYWYVIQQERERIINSIAHFGFVKKCWQSAANFVLLAVSHADSVVSFCLSRGISIKNLDGKPLLDNCIRISIGTPEQNEKLLKVLAEFGELC